MTGASIMDCGDVPISPYDNTLALDQIETAYTTLLSREVATDFIKGELQSARERLRHTKTESAAFLVRHQNMAGPSRWLSTARNIPRSSLLEATTRASLAIARRASQAANPGL